MPVHLLEVTIRPDWQSLSRRMAKQRVRQWHATEATVIVATIMVAALTLFWPTASWIPVLRTLLYSGVFWLFPLAHIYRSRLSAGRIEVQLVDAITLLAAAAGIAFLSSPNLTNRLNAPALALLAMVIPVLTWPWLVRTARRFPAPARQLGLFADQWVWLVVIGIGAGMAIGLHMLVASKALLETHVSPLSAGALVWAACLIAGLTTLGEELFFRGWCYHLLVQRSQGKIWRAVAKITVLNLLIYAAYATTTLPVAGKIGLLAYGALVACGCTLLRHRFHSVLPGVACNIVATLFLVWLIGI